MSASREQILGSLRRRLPGSDEGERAARIEAWANAAVPGPLPALGADPIEAFVIRARAAAAQLVEVASPEQAVETFVQGWRDYGTGSPLVAGPDPRLRRLPWPRDAQVRFRNATAEDGIALTAAYAGIAETGSLVMLSGETSPALLSFLPDHCFCLLERSRILFHPEVLWSRLRADKTAMPRALTMVTGPSRTADVEQTLQLGAHGPRRLTILLI